MSETQTQIVDATQCEVSSSMDDKSDVTTKLEKTPVEENNY